MYQDELPSREQPNDSTGEAASNDVPVNDVPVDEPPTGMGSESAEGINDMGTHVEGERSSLDDRKTGHSFRAGAERAGSEPLGTGGWVHESGYGGRGGEPRTSSEQREESEQESSEQESSEHVEPSAG